MCLNQHPRNKKVISVVESGKHLYIAWDFSYLTYSSFFFLAEKKDFSLLQAVHFFVIYVNTDKVHIITKNPIYVCRYVPENILEKKKMGTYHIRSFFITSKFVFLIV